MYSIKLILVTGFIVVSLSWGCSREPQDKGIVEQETTKILEIETTRSSPLQPPVTPDQESMKVLGIDTPILTTTDELPGNIGRLVTLRGVVGDTKIPDILGVLVSSEDSHRGKICFASGVLVGTTYRGDNSENNPKFRTKITREKGDIRYTLYSNLEGKRSKTKMVDE